jgi:hemoglobin
MKRDITTKEDIEILINTFYDKVVKDELIGRFFKHLDFSMHLPKMIHFWSFVLLDEAGYTTDVTKVHVNMRISAGHFDRWIALFNTTTDALYLGEKAEMAKQRAFLMRWTMESKMTNG